MYADGMRVIPVHVGYMLLRGTVGRARQKFTVRTRRVITRHECSYALSSRAAPTWKREHTYAHLHTRAHVYMRVARYAERARPLRSLIGATYLGATGTRRIERKGEGKKRKRKEREPA